MKIYTKSGDAGETGLLGGGRVPKDHPRIEAFGTVDELNAALGLARAEPLPAEIQEWLGQVQHTLFALGAELARPQGPSSTPSGVATREITELEQAIDQLDERLPPLRQFILPAGSRGSAALHLARAICRRAERRVVTLAQLEPGRVSDHNTIYLNRLSDFLFVVARAINASAGIPDSPWENR